MKLSVYPCIYIFNGEENCCFFWFLCNIDYLGLLNYFGTVPEMFPAIFIDFGREKFSELNYTIETVETVSGISGQ